MVKREEEIWSLVKKIRVLNIYKDVLFEGVSKNYRFQVIRANNVAVDFSMADFSLMNSNDLIYVATILKGTNVLKLQLSSIEYALIGFAHIKLFIDNYYEYHALIDVDLALAVGKQITVPQYFVQS